MARVKDNDLTEGLSGKFGKKIVFRQKNGITIAAQAPKHKVKPTEKQEKKHIFFMVIILYLIWWILNYGDDCIIVYVF